MALIQWLSVFTIIFALSVDKEFRVGNRLSIALICMLLFLTLDLVFTKLKAKLSKAILNLDWVFKNILAAAGLVLPWFTPMRAICMFAMIIGTILNFLVISLNGFKMPFTGVALCESPNCQCKDHDTIYVLLDKSKHRLWFLSDIIETPWHNSISIGDVLITLGFLVYGSTALLSIYHYFLGGDCIFMGPFGVFYLQRTSRV